MRKLMLSLGLTVALISGANADAAADAAEKAFCENRTNYVSSGWSRSPCRGAIAVDQAKVAQIAKCMTEGVKKGWNIPKDPEVTNSTCVKEANAMMSAHAAHVASSARAAPVASAGQPAAPVAAPAAAPVVDNHARASVR